MPFPSDTRTHHSDADDFIVGQHVDRAERDGIFRNFIRLLLLMCTSTSHASATSRRLLTSNPHSYTIS